MIERVDFMPLNKSTGNMYSFITHTWNTVKGKCNHGCSYCYMRRWGEQKEIHFDKSELKTDLGKKNFIFVGSSNDLFACAENLWIDWTILHCKEYDNKYFFQSKNPEKILRYQDALPKKSVVCTTIETNDYYPGYMGNTISTERRALAMSEITLPKYVTIEPIIDFYPYRMANLIRICNPIQVNIGADSGNNNLPEPSKEKLLELIDYLEKFTTVHLKKNLYRLLK